MELQAPKRAWIGAKHFDANNFVVGSVTGVRTEKGKFGTDFIVQIKPLSFLSAEEIEMTVWGMNYNYLYNTLGSNATNWIGKKICIEQKTDPDGKVRRIVTCPKE